MSADPHHAALSADAFVALLQQRAPRPLSIQDMIRMLGVEQYDRRSIKAALEAQVAERKLRRIGKARYQWIRDVERHADGERTARRTPTAAPRARRSGGRVEGRYVRVRAGYGFVEVLGRAAERFPRDILIPTGMEGAALHGDRVEVDIVRRDPRLRRVV